MPATNIYTIYKATNLINGKSYIGFAKNFITRKQKHKSRSKSFQNKFYSAIRKYGWNNFEWSILYQSLDGNHTLTEMETHFIKEYDSFNNGYNLTLGGESNLGWKPKQSTKNKISKATIGRIAWNKGIPNPIAKQRMLTNNPMKQPEISNKVKQKLIGKIPWNKKIS